ncbi:MAG: hypothetical protein GDA50_07330 [Alphaproteobacteria bacterium GM202ARS2]|nr:hypothetical protein [Alphaproteobacteria bacterium GM202ARS2]
MNLDNFIRDLPIVAHLAERTDGNMWVAHLLTLLVQLVTLGFWLTVTYFFWFDGLPPVEL